MQSVKSFKLTIKDACQWFGLSRQAYYQAQQQQRAAEDKLLIELVQNIRQRHPRMGEPKLYHQLQAVMRSLGLKRGRDAFFDLLREHDLLVSRKGNRRRTTHSALWPCPNLLADMTLVRPWQVWVADITYLSTEQGFVYLALLTDAYSRFIVGDDLSTSLALDGCLRALNSALSLSPHTDLAGLIHHSDHGIQSTSGPYRDRLNTCSIRSSMGKIGNCFDNPLAERLNGILKDEYNLDSFFVDFQQALLTVQRSIWLYNFERPHYRFTFVKPFIFISILYSYLSLFFINLF